MSTIKINFGPNDFDESLFHAMRKYRYTDPTGKSGRNRVIGQAVKFFIAWNGFGYLLWQFMKSNARELDTDFDKKSSQEQVYSMMGKRDLDSYTNIRYKVSTKGIHRVEDKNAESDINNEITDVETTISETNSSQKLSAPANISVSEVQPDISGKPSAPTWSWSFWKSG